MSSTQHGFLFRRFSTFFEALIVKKQTEFAPPPHVAPTNLHSSQGISSFGGHPDFVFLGNKQWRRKQALTREWLVSKKNCASVRPWPSGMGGAVNSSRSPSLVDPCHCPVSARARTSSLTDLPTRYRNLDSSWDIPETTLPLGQKPTWSNQNPSV